ncbi:MAG: hypothetical protein GY953_00925 [bacterium]|nr:hypothetical protein [bacterium]
MGAIESEKTMFEVYRETAYSGQYRVVYFTELQDHNKETEINRAMAGEHFVDGFLRNYTKDKAKPLIDELIERMNRGEPLNSEQFLNRLAEFLA